MMTEVIILTQVIIAKLSPSPVTWHEALSNKNIRIPRTKKNRGPPIPPALCYIWADKGGYFQKLS